MCSPVPCREKSSVGCFDWCCSQPTLKVVRHANDVLHVKLMVQCDKTSIERIDMGMIAKN